MDDQKQTATGGESRAEKVEALEQRLGWVASYLLVLAGLAVVFYPKGDMR